MGKWKSASFTISTTPTPVRNDENKRFAFETDITPMLNGIKKSRIADNTNVLNNAGPQHSTNPICSRKTEATAPNATTASGKQSREPSVSQSKREEAQPTVPDIPLACPHATPVWLANIYLQNSSGLEWAHGQLHCLSRSKGFRWSVHRGQ